MNDITVGRKFENDEVKTKNHLSSEQCLVRRGGWNFKIRFRD